MQKINVLTEPFTDPEKMVNTCTRARNSEICGKRRWVNIPEILELALQKINWSYISDQVRSVSLLHTDAGRYIRNKEKVFEKCRFN